MLALPKMRKLEVARAGSLGGLIAAVAACLGSAVVLGVLMSSPSATRIAVAGVLVIGALAITVRAPTVVLYLLPIWLVALGTIRRLTAGLVGAGTGIDPLLAVEPVILGVLVLVAARSGAFRNRTRLTNAIVLLTGILIVSALNPLQGSLKVGLTGAVIVVSPMLAFLVGRAMLTDRVFARILMVVAGLAVPAAAYGLYQVFGHFPSWDQRWLDQQGAFLALIVGTSIRPFGSFASGQEFGLYAAVGLVTLLAFARRSRWLWTLPPIVLLGAAVWYESSRTIVVFLAFTAALAGATRLGWTIRRSLLAAVIVLLALPTIASHVLPSQFSGTTSDLQSHQVSGLIDPLAKDSSLHSHISLITNGLQQGITNPLGRGVGSVTGAAGKFGTSSAGTEADLGNVAVAGGMLGLITYLIVVGRGLGRASEQALGRRDALSIAALSILAVTLLQWLNGGLYSVGWLPWLILGWVDRPPDGDLHEPKGVVVG